SVPAPTSTALARLDANGAATYEFDLLWDPRPVGLPDDVDAVHTSSIAAVLEPGAATVLDVLRRHRGSATISYDPNARPTLMGDPGRVRAQIEATIALSDVVKASDEDVSWLYGTDDVEDVVDSWRELGPALTVLTRGDEGAVGFCGSGRVQVSPVVVDAVDTVGAGDTFSAGILDALAAKGLLGAEQRGALAALPSDEVADVLRRAAALAAITVSRAGANPPWSHELSCPRRGHPRRAADPRDARHPVFPVHQTHRTTFARPTAPRPEEAIHDPVHVRGAAGRLPHRARHDGRGPRARLRPVPGTDPACGAELPDLRPGPGARAHPRARPGEEGRRTSQQGARRPRRRDRRRHR